MRPLIKASAKDNIAAGTVCLSGGVEEWTRVIRRMIENCLGRQEGQRIIEIGCGQGDLSGPLSVRHSVIMADSDGIVLADVHHRYPDVVTIKGEISKIPPVECDLLLLCNVLEYVRDPLALVHAWLPKARKAIVSHPLDEGDALAEAISGGTQCWSFSTQDFQSWYEVGGHVVEEKQVLTDSSDKSRRLITGRSQRFTPLVLRHI